MTVTVTLPRVDAAFPPFCVACSGAAGRVILLRSRGSRREWGGWHLGSVHSVSIPACDGCAVRVRWRRWARVLLTWTSLSLTVVLLFALAPGLWRRPPGAGALGAHVLLKVLLIGCGAFGAAVGYTLAGVVMPVPFDFRVDEDTGAYSYDFRNATYARAFALLNGVPPPPGPEGATPTRPG